MFLKPLEALATIHMIPTLRKCLKYAEEEDRKTGPFSENQIRTCGLLKPILPTLLVDD